MYVRYNITRNELAQALQYSINAVLLVNVDDIPNEVRDRLAVALRAGVSVGTLYQYFPNKSALLKAALKRHMDEVTEAIELVCHQQKGHSLEQMAVATFLRRGLPPATTWSARE